MFILVREPACWWPVRWNFVTEAGEIAEADIRVKMRRLPVDEAAKLLSAEAQEEHGDRYDRHFFDRVVTDWEGVTDAAANKLPMADPHIGAMLTLPGFGMALAAAFLALQRADEEHRRGNSDASPATGQSATPVKPAQTEAATAVGGTTTAATKPRGTRRSRGR